MDKALGKGMRPACSDTALSRMSKYIEVCKKTYEDYTTKFVLYFLGSILKGADIESC